MDFGEAVRALKAGKAVIRSDHVRREWRYIVLLSPAQQPPPRMGCRHFYVSKYGETVPWSPTQEDILAEDWELADYQFTS